MLDPLGMTVATVSDHMIAPRDSKLRQRIARPDSFGRRQSEHITAKFWHAKTILDAPQTTGFAGFLDERTIHQTEPELRGGLRHCYSLLLQERDTKSAKPFLCAP